jgi:hypothetical protein
MKRLGLLNDLTGGNIEHPWHSHNNSKVTERTQTKMYAGRKVWTHLETAALVDGLKRVDDIKLKWAAIKNMFPDCLADRTSTQIKVSRITKTLCYGDTYKTTSTKGEFDLTKSVLVVVHY